MKKNRTTPADNYKTFEHNQKLYRVGIDDKLDIHFQDSPNGTAWIKIGTCTEVENFDYAIEISKDWINSGKA